MQDSFKSSLKKLGIPNKKFHTVRHTFCTLLFESAVQLKTASILMGHTDISTTAAIYTHIDTSENEKAIRKLSNLI